MRKHAKPRNTAGEFAGKHDRPAFPKAPRWCVKSVKLSTPKYESSIITLSPLLEQLARNVYAMLGRYVLPTLGFWKWMFLGCEDPYSVILKQEAFARAFTWYVALHPEASDNTEIAQSFGCYPDSGLKDKENEAEVLREIKELVDAAWDRIWIPLVKVPVVFPTDSPIVLDFSDVIEMRDGLPYPNLRGDHDYRQVLFTADVVGIVDADSDEVFGIYPDDTCLQKDRTLPRNSRAVFIRLGLADEVKDQEGALNFVLAMVKDQDDNLSSSP